MTTPRRHASVPHADRHDAFPEVPCGTAVLLLAGSSGRVESQRADLLARHGARVRAIRWFGGMGQRPAPHEVPIELFIDQLDLLRRDADRVAIFGTSVVWAGLTDGDWSSHWTSRGTPLPAVSFDPSWVSSTVPPEYRSLYEASIDRAPDAAAAAAIRTEYITGVVVLIAGGDDRVWPSGQFAAEISARRSAHGRETTVVTHPAAGHRMVLPGETVAAGGVTMARGGSPSADAELGALAWPQIVHALDLRA